LFVCLWGLSTLVKGRNCIALVGRGHACTRRTRAKCGWVIKSLHEFGLRCTEDAVGEVSDFGDERQLPALFDNVVFMKLHRHRRHDRDFDMDGRCLARHSVSQATMEALLGSASEDGTLDGEPRELAAKMYEAARALACERSGGSEEALSVLDCCDAILGELGVGAGSETAPVRGPARKKRRSAAARHVGAPAATAEYLSECRELSAASRLLRGMLVEWSSAEAAAQCYQEAAALAPAWPEPPLQLGRLLWKRASSATDLARVEGLLRSSCGLATAAIQAAGYERKASKGPVRKGAKSANAKAATDGGEAARAAGPSGAEEARASLAEAQRLLARLCSQSPGRRADAHGLLRALGFTHTLAHAVTSTNWGALEAAAHVELPVELGDGEPAVSVFDDALRADMLAHMRAVLGPDAPFWHEHRYDSPDTGFFSYQVRVLVPAPRSEGHVRSTGCRPGIPAVPSHPAPRPRRSTACCCTCGAPPLRLSRL
jgi:hypothetical protein